MKTNIRVNVIANLIRTITVTVLSFITFPYVCRVLGDSSLGIYTWASTFVYYFVILAKTGVPNLAIRECVKIKDDKEKLSNMVQKFFIIQAVMSLVSFGLMVAIMFTVGGQLTDPNYKGLIFVLSLNFLIGTFSFEWVYIALEKHFYITFRSIVVSTLVALLIFTYVKYPEDFYVYSLFTISITIFTVIANCAYIHNFISFKKTQPYDFKSVIKPLLVLTALALVVTLYNQTDEFILGYLNIDKTEVGSYAVGIKGVDIIITIITSLSAVFIPRSSYLYSKGRMDLFDNLTKYSLNICFFIALPAIATMSSLSLPITRLISGNYDLNYTNLSSSYGTAPMVLIILCLIMLTYSIGDIIYCQVLIPMKKEKVYLLTMAIGVVANVVGSVLLGYFVFKDDPSIGVAIATCATDILIIAFLLIKTKKYTSKAVFNNNNLKILLLAGIICGFTFAAGPYIYSSLISLNCDQVTANVLELVIVVLIDAIIYVGGLLLLKETLVSSFLKKRNKKGEVIDGE